MITTDDLETGIRQLIEAELDLVAGGSEDEGEAGEAHAGGNEGKGGKGKKGWPAEDAARATRVRAPTFEQ